MNLLVSDSRNHCPECGGTEFVTDYEVGEVICNGCGFVVKDDVISHEPEWRAFTREQRDKRQRTGNRETFRLHDKGLTTTIDRRNKDAQGKSLAPKLRAQIYRMRKWQQRSRISNTMERNLTIALSSMQKTCSDLRLPQSVLETASVIYRKALERRLIRGRSIQGVSAASIYMACRKCEIARTLDEIALAMNLDKKSVGRCYRFMVQELGETVPLASPTYYISRITTFLGVTGRAETVATNILKEARIR